MSSKGLAACRVVRRNHDRVLAALSKRLGGASFASVCPFLTDHQARPAILISGLPEHTRNLAADPRASLIAHPCADNMYTAGRVTLTGQAENIGWPHELAR
jgi:putative heme iron utilization protein